MSMPEAFMSNDNARNAWLEKVLSAIPAGSSVLDVGAGEQANRRYCQHLNYVSQDFCQYDGCGDRAGLQTERWDTSRIDIVSDITDIPRESASFDLVLCTEVLEHVPNPVAALNELCRLVKPGGQLVMTSPFWSLTHFSPYHFSSGFNRYFFEHHLPQNGLVVEEMVANGNYFACMAQELGRLPDIFQKYTGKKQGLAVRIATRLLLPALKLAAGEDKGSSELFCFGYLVRARKPLP